MHTNGIGLVVSLTRDFRSYIVISLIRDFRTLGLEVSLTQDFKDCVTRLSKKLMLSGCNENCGTVYNFKGTVLDRFLPLLFPLTSTIKTIE